MDELLRIITDNSQNGLICVDKKGAIMLFNPKAMEIIGGRGGGGRAHPAGVLEPGDVVLIADNMLGDDDGGLAPEDLAALNIHEPDLRPGDALLAAGVYRNDSLAPLYRFSGQLALPRRFVLEGPYLGLDIFLAVDREDKNLIIRVGEADFTIHYHHSVGNVVVLDGATGAVKFFQWRGSTLRHEDIHDLLCGARFAAKGMGGEDMHLVGENFFSVFTPGDLAQRLADVLEGRCPEVRRENLGINKRLMLTSILPITRGQRIMGAVIDLTDLSELDKLLRERNAFIAKLEEEGPGDENSAMQEIPAGAFSTFAGNAPSMQRVKYLAYRAACAQAGCNVIITGESGTGKSQLAKEIHQLSRPGKPMVEVNCSSIPQELFESELFGYVGGAFTGALSAGKPGYFEQAEGGTLFLDELAELQPNIQVKLLYVIQNKRFYRVGATKPTDVDVRIICATNKDLAEQMRRGDFREDLFYRINIFPIEIPPLRSRISDIYLLSKSLTERICDEYGLRHKQLSGKALEKLVDYDWPGNIRELGNVIERAIVVSDGAIIYPDAIFLDGASAHQTPGAAESKPACFQAGVFSRGSLRQVLAAAEAQAIRAALAEAGGDKKKAMAALGLKKTTFYEKLHTHRIEE